MSRLTADLLRVLAMLAVIAIHGTDAWRTVTEWPVSGREWTAFGIDQAARFCVPLFVLLSGYALAKRYGDSATGRIARTGGSRGARENPPWSLREFLSARFARVGLPFLTWSLANLVVLIAIGCLHWRQTPDVAALSALRADDAPPAWAALRWLLTGAADYHLYFLPIVIQCYLLFPLVRRWRFSWTAFSLAAVLPLAGFLAWKESARIWGVWIPPLWSVFPLAWIGYFLAGTWLAREEDGFVRWVERLPAALCWLLVLCGPAAVVGDALVEIALGVPPEGAGGFDRPAVMLFPLALIVAVVRMRRPLDRVLAPLAKAVTEIAAASFITYLAHTWVLRGLESSGLKAVSLALWLPAAIAGSLIFGVWLHRIGKLYPRFGMAIGA
ncbi:MAG: acyltransferase [Planctomycetes bacterium]|nr:acyltransferase [Planctomycetota bacterium]